MLMSLKYKFLFVHIAKTGGTSVRTTLNRYRWSDPSYYPAFLCSRISSLMKHRIGTKLPRHARAICAYEMLPREVYDSLFKFAFVRNPWDLQVSSYHHLKRERPHLLEGKDDFETFLRWKLDPGRVYQYHIDTSISLQSDYVIDLHGKIIVDFIGRYENLNDDFCSVCSKIGVRAPRLAHKRKAGDRDTYRKYYNDSTAALVADYFRRDIEMFDYSFEG